MRYSHRQGSILVLVLIVLSSMTALAVGLAYRTRIQVRLAYANSRRTQAHYLALGGIERMKVLLGTLEDSGLTVTAACQFTSTAEDERLLAEFKDFDPAEGSLLTYSLRDELAHFNVNKPDPPSWKNTGHISKALCSSIIDWIDEDDDVNPDGAETDLYQRLEPPHISKNGSCVTLKELLYVKGVTRETYLGEDLNRNYRLDENEKDGLFEMPSDNGDNRLDSGFVDLFTVYGDGRININTASATILGALEGVGEEAAQLILAHRAGPDGVPGTEDDRTLATAEDIEGVQGLSELETELLQQYCCFDSSVFRIFSAAGLNKEIKCSLMAIVKRDKDNLQIVYLERLF
jgi:type II secretory pathway component PulK